MVVSRRVPSGLQLPPVTALVWLRALTLRRRSPALEVKILARTTHAVLRGDGAY